MSWAHRWKSRSIHIFIVSLLLVISGLLCYCLWKHYFSTDPGITTLVKRYEQLTPEARKQLEEVWDDLLQQSLQNPHPKIISWQDAVKHYGEYCTVEGTIVVAHNSGKACFFNFHSNWKAHFSAVIFAEQFDLFPANPEQYYLHKKVRITGFIKEYKGKPEIILESPEQIEIIDEKAE